MRGLRDAEADVAAGNVVEGVQAIRALRPARLNRPNRLVLARSAVAGESQMTCRWLASAVIGLITGLPQPARDRRELGRELTGWRARRGGFHIIQRIAEQVDP